MRLRDVLESRGAHITGYIDGHLGVAMPRGNTAECVRAARAAGLEVSTQFLFPADTGSPDSLLHWRRTEDIGNRSASYWHHVHFGVSSERASKGGTP